MQSGVVEFVMGKNRRRFSIHAALAGVFPKEIFQPPINGQINEVVFGRCCEFVYSGDYSVPLLTAYPCGDDGDQTSDSQVLSRGSARRWDPMNHRGNLFHPTTLPDICAFTAGVEYHGDTLPRTWQCSTGYEPGSLTNTPELHSERGAHFTSLNYS
ncbi:hypothetical protein BDV23DRAFT_43032 [Aspergillus alliaceus]|uniref:Uncharacterized protein n=1 Tax=Petromyces alliaceus TaxID=209559 RepID=A0A5N7BRE5_PETAA|nr:hypothetical protein BDV23DRAFT_43032 [Aspergillus alliaceus]